MGAVGDAIQQGLQSRVYRRLGSAAEQFVAKLEGQVLVETGREDLAKRVEVFLRRKVMVSATTCCRLRRTAQRSTSK